MSNSRATAIGLALCIGLVGAGARDACSSLIDTDLDRALQDVVSAPDGPPGAIAIVQRGNRIRVFSAGLGDVANRRRMRPTDRMRIASVAKAFSGAVALSLVDRGVLSLDDTIGELLPGLGNGWEDVTLRQLLNHTSGVPSFTSSSEFAARVDAFPHDPVPPRALVEYVADEELLFTPGSRYAYSNTDNILVGLMAEAATGRSYQHLLAARVLSPIELRRTTLPFGYRMPRPYIHGYDFNPALPFDVSEIVAAGYSWASGGIVSTPLELNRFIRAYAGGELFGGEARAQQLELVAGGSSEPPGPGRNSAGLAIFRYETDCGTVYGHTGNIFGYTQFTAATLDGRSSVVVSVNEQVV
ncbi:MAG: serine hydrolase domain-containing protein, partial [Thermodesulfobacteriota bacterium]